MAAQVTARPIRITYKYLEPGARVFLIRRPHPYYTQSDAHIEYLTVPWPVRLTHGADLRFDNALISLRGNGGVGRSASPLRGLRGLHDLSHVKEPCEPSGYEFDAVTNDYAASLAGLLRMPYVSLLETEEPNVTVFFKPAKN